jgi:indole-3-glycerol phosphate synthase
MAPPNVLKKILEHKQREIELRRQTFPLALLRQLTKTSLPTRGFIQALRDRIQNHRIAIIAEMKKASPSKGVLRLDYNPTEIAQSYAQSGATCLSVLTDTEFFKGCNEHLYQVHDACDLPLLRKDFIIDPYQVYEARVLRADCILLIVAALSQQQLYELSQLAMRLGMDVLIEVHDREELNIALALDLPLIGINNRNLGNFETHLTTTINLFPHIPSDRLVVSESGIHTARDIAYLHHQNVNAFLIGEAFMRAADPGTSLKNILGEDSFSV